MVRVLLKSHLAVFARVWSGWKQTFSNTVLSENVVPVVVLLMVWNFLSIPICYCTQIIKWHFMWSAKSTIDAIFSILLHEPQILLKYAERVIDAWTRVASSISSIIFIHRHQRCCRPSSVWALKFSEDRKRFLYQVILLLQTTQWWCEMTQHRLSRRAMYLY